MSCDLSTPWTVEKNRQLGDVVVYRKESPQNVDHGDSQLPKACGLSLNKPKSDTDDSADFSSCDLCLTAQQHQEDILRGRNQVITAVDVLCDGRHMEVFSDIGEYIETARGIRVDEELGEKQKLFLIQYSFDKPVRKTKLRLASLLHPEKVWLHSMYITMDSVVADASASLPGVGMVSLDVDKVKERLSDLGTDVPEQARVLLAAMETMQQKRRSMMDSMRVGSSASAPPQMAALMAMFSAMKPPSTDSAPKLNDIPSASQVPCQQLVGSTQNSMDGPSSSQADSETPRNVGSDRTNSAFSLSACDESNEETNHDLSDMSQQSPNDKMINLNEKTENTQISSDGNSEIEQTTKKSVEDSTVKDMLFDMERRIGMQIQTIEERLSAQITEQVSKAESRLSQKLDELIRLVSLRDSAKTFVDSTELD